jgi:hemolysin III
MSNSIAKLREPVNSLTHGIGFVLSLIALVLMTSKGIINGLNGKGISALIIFGVSLCLLYFTSSTYHGVKCKESIILTLRKLDHSMIFVLIAGSYAPYCLIALEEFKGTLFFIIISSLALLGILFKLIWFNAPRWLQTSLYIALGWAAAFMIKPLSSVLPFASLLFLVLGGVLYTIGGVIYGIKPKKLTIGVFGFHEIFHIFIMLGSLCHFVSVFFYVI